ncbi:MAG: DapH/DapD/GlmU-related protein [Candidatus Wallbacteria bacterium]|nr:DapH/DapD/GlmU-related protein [Candidatus Wallbacteria bacterium]
MDDYLKTSGKKIRDFLKSDDPFVKIKGPAANFRENRFCCLCWPTPAKRVRLLKNYFLSMLAFVAPTSDLKTFIFRLMGVKIGKNVEFAVWVSIEPSFPELVSIDDNALIGLGVQIATHEMTHSSLRIGRVKIGKNAVIGGGTIIRGGVTVGDNAVTGIGAVVLNDVAPGTTVVGNPARPLAEVLAENDD